MSLKDCKVGLYEKALPKRLGWKQKIREAKAAGYDFIENSIDETEEKMARVRPDSPQGMETVSYTHLDVYKRQVPAGCIKRKIDIRRQVTYFDKGNLTSVAFCEILQLLLVFRRYPHRSNIYVNTVKFLIVFE